MTGAGAARARLVYVRASFGFAALVSIVACSSVAPETASSGRIRQIVQYARYGETPKVDFVFVVNAERSERGDALIGNAYRSVLANALGMVGQRGGLWNPIQFRAFVVSVETGKVLEPRTQVNLAWIEPDASREGAETFASAVRAALVDSMSEVARTDGQVAVLRKTLSVLDAPPDDVMRRAILLTTADDTAAESAIDDDLGTLRRSGMDDIVVAAPGEKGPYACRGTTPVLEAWATSNRRVELEPSCDRLSLGLIFHADIGWRCSSPAATFSNCRVRAFVPSWESCDPQRGWRDASNTRSTSADLEGMKVCDVAQLAGESRELCETSRLDDRRVSGWCLPQPDRYCAGPLPRIVGGAAPFWATIELVCDAS